MELQNRDEMTAETTVLRAMGGLYEANALLHCPGTPSELAELFAAAAERRVKLTLVGSQRSFGEHFLPPAGAEAVSTTALGGSVRALDRQADGSLWVRASAGLTFEELCRRLPGYIPFHPPTGERISLGGALAACTHDAVGFFADDVRAFSLLAPNGTVYECRAGAAGNGGELFRAAPGSFGALGAILELEVRLRAVPDTQRAEINVLEKCPTKGYRALERLESVHRNCEYPLGRGLFFFGRRGPSVLLGDNIVATSPSDWALSLPLTDDAWSRNIAAQALANRFPAFMHRLQPWMFKRGRRFHASMYGFCFYQRSYDRAFEYLSRRAPGDWAPLLLRCVGVDPRLTVCHQSFAVPIACVRDFLDLYFGVFDRYPDVERRLEQQDMIRLPECRWPMHGAYGMFGGSYLFTASFSVRRGQPSEARARRFLAQVSAMAFARLGVKVLLLKQVHCDLAIMRQMHQPFVEALRVSKQRFDPAETLTSRLLQSLGV